MVYEAIKRLRQLLFVHWVNRALYSIVVLAFMTLSRRLMVIEAVLPSHHCLFFA